MFAAVKIHQDFNTGKKTVDQYGLKYISNQKNKCIDYLRSNHYLFTEMCGYYYGAVVEFDPTLVPKTMAYYKECPNLHICFKDESEYMVKNIIYKS